MRRRGAWGLASVALAVVALLAGSAPSVAQTAATGALVVSPGVAELSLAPGQAFQDQITIENRFTEPLKVFATTGDIEPDGNGFAYRPAGTSVTSSAAAWISLSPSTIEIPAGSTATVTAAVRVPSGAPVGGHYAGIQLAATRATGASVQTLHALLIEVPGTGLTRAGRVLGVTLPRFEINGTPAIRMRIENGGNTHLRVGGTITLRDRLRRRTVETIQVPPFYVLPGTTTTHTVLWNDPPLLAYAHAKVHLDLLDACRGEAAAACEATGSGVVLHWWIIAGFAAFLLLVRVLMAVARLRRRRRERMRARAPYRPPAAVEPAAVAGNGEPVPPPGAPTHAGRGAAWDPVPSMQGSIALRRARSALRMLREGAGETGVRIEVALGLLRSVRDVPAVVSEVERVYADAVARRAQREAAALALALQEVDSVRAPEALLRGYAKADRVLGQRIKRALAECDPADLRAHRDLLDALPASRRQSLPVA